MRRFATILALLLALGLADARPAAAQAFDTKAPEAILVDFDSGTVLFEKAADDKFEPASMAKLMTIELAFKELKEKRITLDQTFNVSEYAWRTGGAPSGGAAMYAAIHSDVAVSDLLRGLIVQSGNDAAIIVAEGIAGSEPAFVDLMNQRARELGMRNSNFTNSSGLPDPAQLVTARDLAVLARHIISEYPDNYPIFAEPEFTWNKIRQTNRTPMIGEGIGVDGLKTGFLKGSGYSLTASALRNGQRLVLVVAGLDTDGDREADAKKLFDWGFRNFQRVTAFNADEVVAEASVYGGVVGHVALKADGAIQVLVPRDAKDAIKARVIYRGPLIAPVEAGMPVGSLKIWSGDRLIQETPLHTAAAVERGPLRSRALDALSQLLFGWL